MMTHNASDQMYAHTKPGLPCSHWEPLIDHLRHVANRAGEFASAFDARELAYAAGWWHDLGKASVAFQEGVLGRGEDEADTDAGEETGENANATARPSSPKRRRVDHSTAGARHAIRELGHIPGHLLAYGIAGHHGRLPNWRADSTGSTLHVRLNEKNIEPIDPPSVALHPVDPSQILPRGFTLVQNAPGQAFQLGLLTRMLFSALVDADRLETERFCNPQQSALRPAGGPGVSDLLDRLDAHLIQLRENKTGDPSPVDHYRDQVFAASRHNASKSSGIFSLTVPTGGGKTYASMAFALEHAKLHSQCRVIYALPFTSIIEQTAADFNNVFGYENVLEHHSNLDINQRNRRSITAEMASENFDSPIVVTTNVQLFESLFSAHGSTCRKLHRFANSVIVLDEAQAMPPRLLRPTLAVLKELVRNYHCTIALCTATQPAINHRADFNIGFEHVTEIVPNPRDLYKAMQRVRVKHLGLIDDDVLAKQIGQHEQVLCIVNTRKHAVQLAEKLKLSTQGDVIHLSASMCPAHRSECVKQIKQALKDNQACRVISTQVIEAGVDVDFPAVYRALAGFDSIAQAAGRCNREGRQAMGQVFVFETEHVPPASLQTNVDAAGDLFEKYKDPLSLDAIEAYFCQVYWKRQHEGKKKWDAKDVMGCFASETQHDFRVADERFCWIENQTTPVIVPFGSEGQRIVNHLLAADAPGPDWQLLRSAQRYSVSVYGDANDPRSQLSQLIDNTAVTACFDDRFWVLTNPDAYDDQLGLRLDVVGWDIDRLTGL